MDDLDEHQTPHDQVHTIYFGPAWNRNVLHRSRRVDTPLGQKCLFCEETIVQNDRGLLSAVVRLDPDGDPVAEIQPVHAECDAYPYIGHRVRVCPCTGHPPTRATALLAWQRAQLDGAWH